MSASLLAVGHGRDRCRLSSIRFRDGLPTLDLLARSRADGLLAAEEYADALACHLRQQLRCSTVELWRFALVCGSRTLVRIGLCRTDAAGGVQLRVPPSAALGRYMTQLRALGVYACDDIHEDLLGRALKCGDAMSDQPRAFMDTLLVINAETIGVLSCQQDCGTPRWATNERALFRRLAARVALHLAQIEMHRCALDNTAGCRDARDSTAA